MADQMTARCSSPVAAKQVQIITPLQKHLLKTVLDSRYEMFVQICCVFAKCGTVHCGLTSPLWSLLSKRHSDLELSKPNHCCQGLF